MTANGCEVGGRPHWSERLDKNGQANGNKRGNDKTWHRVKSLGPQAGSITLPLRNASEI